VRDTANKLTQGLDFLCLQQCCLSPLAAGNFLPELTVGPLKLSRPLSHHPLKLHGNPALGFEICASFVLSSSSALRGNNRGLQRDGLQRPLKKADVPQARDEFAPERGKLGTLIVVGQHDKGLI
jgi:hypothetical protein